MGATTTDFRLLSRCADSRTDFTLAEPNICHTDWFRDASTLLVVASLLHSEISYFIVISCFSPLSLTLCLHNVIYVLSTHFPKNKFTKPLAIATIGIPLGDLLAGEMSAKFRSTGYWRTPLQITAGIYLAVLAPFFYIHVTQGKTARSSGQSFQTGKPRRSWATSVTLIAEDLTMSPDFKGRVAPIYHSMGVKPLSYQSPQRPVENAVMQRL
ncbi:hypothetical protein BSL78_21918 [Apostichopus japonicus]|uniref:Uncharacterized protein n=1 Tax=Stichopus japonicus TaxID=307972 RepID=A0A2G8JZM3_STIJA|nr:hypothetical protein BSL78_21918 [Apostichopus japonicus]